MRVTSVREEHEEGSEKAWDDLRKRAGGRLGTGWRGAGWPQVCGLGGSRFGDVVVARASLWGGRGRVLRIHAVAAAGHRGEIGRDAAAWLAWSGRGHDHADVCGGGPVGGQAGGAPGR